METCQQDASSEGESVKGGRPAANLPASPSKKKVSKKKRKKKKKKKAVCDHEKHVTNMKKRSIFSLFRLELLRRQKRDGAPQEDNAKRVPGRATRNPLLTSTSATSVSAREAADPPNDSLRWDGVLEDSVAEEGRLDKYRLHRRRRFRAFLQQSSTPGPAIPGQQLPELGKVAEAEKEGSLHKSKSSSVVTTKSKRRLSSKLGPKISKRQPGVLQPSKSQGVL